MDGGWFGIFFGGCGIGGGGGLNPPPPRYATDGKSIGVRHVM